ncbi:MAG: hypothetical protein N0E59_17855 [Candidatus Thiodiazotropha taylori]|nr:hypothetical protein [Candidatus Thiodiazotropha taylori]MCW4284981.1 hypothetical protein [Candidatus Thiodiazotropha taylori]
MSRSLAILYDHEGHEVWPFQGVELYAPFVFYVVKNDKVCDSAQQYDLTEKSEFALLFA